MGVVWLVLIIAFVVVEAFTYQMVSVWFAGGALCALAAMLCGANTTVQWCVFVGVAILLLICTRPLVRKLMKNKGEKTNVDSVVGKQVVVTEEVNNLLSTGQAKLSGNVWTVRSSEDTIIEPGTTVTVEKVEGVKLIVK